ncbi:MAG TPA: hypothetical protein VGK99_10500, partial [Acidobacteriota bacterium]
MARVRYYPSLTDNASVQDKLNGKSVLPWTLSEAVNREYAKVLIPLAISYGAGVLDFFLRGSLDLDVLECGEDGFLVFRNTSDESLNGKFQLFYDDEQENRTEIGVQEGSRFGAYVLGPSVDSQIFRFTVPAPYDSNKKQGRYMLVFKGRLGEEDDYVMGRYARATECDFELAATPSYQKILRRGSGSLVNNVKLKAVLPPKFAALKIDELVKKKKVQWALSGPDIALSDQEPVNPNANFSTVSLNSVGIYKASDFRLTNEARKTVASSATFANIQVVDDDPRPPTSPKPKPVPGDNTVYTWTNTLCTECPDVITYARRGIPKLGAISTGRFSSWWPLGPGGGNGLAEFRSMDWTSFLSPYGPTLCVLALSGTLAFQGQDLELHMQVFAPPGNNLGNVRVVFSSPTDLSVTGVGISKMFEVEGNRFAEIPVSSALEPAKDIGFRVRAPTTGIKPFTLDITGDTLSQADPSQKGVFGPMQINSTVEISKPELTLGLSFSDDLLDAGSPFGLTTTVFNAPRSGATAFNTAIAVQADSTASLVGKSTAALGNIAPGEARSADFQFISGRTGAVQGATARASAGLNVEVSVAGKRAFPPIYPIQGSAGLTALRAQAPDLAARSMEMLGMIYGDGVGRGDGMEKSTVIARSQGLHTAGYRLLAGEMLQAVLPDLILDLGIGTVTHPEYDYARRNYPAGKLWRDAMNQSLQSASLAPSAA